MSIGINIKNKRTQKGMSQELLAENLYISQGTLSNLEADKSTPDVILLKRIANALETDINELMDDKTIFTNYNQRDGSNCSEIVNLLSDKINELYVKLLDEKDFVILQKNKKITKLKKKIKTNHNLTAPK